MKSGSGSDIDDRSTFARAHWCQKSIGQLDQGFYVEVDHVQLACQIKFFKVAHRTKSGVVYEHVDFEAALFSLRKKPRWGIWLRKIEYHVLRANRVISSKLVAKSDQLVF